METSLLFLLVGVLRVSALVVVATAFTPFTSRERETLIQDYFLLLYPTYIKHNISDSFNDKQAGVSIVASSTSIVYSVSVIVLVAPSRNATVVTMTISWSVSTILFLLYVAS